MKLDSSLIAALVEPGSQQEAESLLRELAPDAGPDGGTVVLGSNVQVAYYDQQREQLDPERTVFDTIGEGNDTVTVNGNTRHIHGYLQDFLFPPERARAPVKALSGGERNRLLLARLFTRAANVLVLDEPTNDLDLETLEILEAELAAWQGTLLLVSHDRVFLDNVVTSTLVLEGDGHVGEYVGGYEDWMRQKSRPEPVETSVAARSRDAASGASLAHALRSVLRRAWNAPRTSARKPSGPAEAAIALRPPGKTVRCSARLSEPEDRYTLSASGSHSTANPSRST